jgi:hypothetical protein
LHTCFKCRKGSPPHMIYVPHGGGKRAVENKKLGQYLHQKFHYLLITKNKYLVNLNNFLFYKIEDDCQDGGFFLSVPRGKVKMLTNPDYK